MNIECYSEKMEKQVNKTKVCYICKKPTEYSLHPVFTSDMVIIKGIKQCFKCLSNNYKKK
jgi:hypothetical protein